MAFEVKQYLDYSGLQAYDTLLKQWVQNFHNSSASELQASVEALEQLVGEGTVDERVAAAVASIIDNSPETFDTLKEVADWIESHGEAAAALIERVSELESEVAAVDKKADDIYAAIQSISGTYIEALFLNPIAYDNSLPIAEQIAALGEGDKLVIDADTDAVVSENIAINSDCVIEAEGVEFTGDITVADGTAVTVIGATFSGTVTVQ